MATPPGISERDFARALTEFRNAVGAEWVFTSDEEINLYRDAYSPFKGEAEDRVPSAAVAPNSTEQVQAVMRIANAHRSPLWTISTGRNPTWLLEDQVMWTFTVNINSRNRRLTLTVNPHGAYRFDSTVPEPGFADGVMAAAQMSATEWHPTFFSAK